MAKAKVKAKAAVKAKVVVKGAKMAAKPAKGKKC